MAALGAMAVADGFLGRWSRRKQDAREGKPAAPEPEAPAAAVSAVRPPAQVPTAPEPATPPTPSPQGSASTAEEAPPLPTLADAQALTPESDFKPFVARAVSPEVRNLAMKKLFADPHFNVMDGLDIYIGDYTQPDPLPAGMLRQMASAHALGLFDHEKKEAQAPDPLGDAAPPAAIAPEPAQPREDAGASDPADVAQSGVCTAVPSAAPSEPEPAATVAVSAAPASHPEHDHDDASLRLQPDHAPQRESAGRGTA